MKNEAKKAALKKLISAMHKRMAQGKPDSKVAPKDIQDEMSEPEEIEEIEEEETPQPHSGIVTISIGAMKNLAKKASKPMPTKAKK